VTSILAQGVPPDELVLEWVDSLKARAYLLVLFLFFGKGGLQDPTCKGRGNLQKKMTTQVSPTE
jgi:hypothetical protein